jgi:hypothetical protein
MAQKVFDMNDSSTATTAATPSSPSVESRRGEGRVECGDWYVRDYDPDTCEPLSVEDEVQRLQHLKSLNILDRPYCDWYNARTAIAASVAKTPWSCITLIDLKRVWIFAGNDNFRSWAGDLREFPRTEVACSHTVLLKSERSPARGSGRALVVPDLTKDHRFCNYPSVVAGAARFYAGTPLCTSPDPHDPSGKRRQIGVLCVMDKLARPEGLSHVQKRLLSELARIIMIQIESEQKFRDESLREAAFRRRSFSLNDFPRRDVLQASSGGLATEPGLVDRKRSLPQGFAAMSIDSALDLRCAATQASVQETTKLGTHNAVWTQANSDVSPLVGGSGGIVQESSVHQYDAFDRRTEADRPGPSVRQRIGELFSSKLSVRDVVRCLQLAESISSSVGPVQYSVSPGTESLDILVGSDTQVFSAALAAFHCTLDPSRAGPIVVRIGTATSGELKRGYLPVTETSATRGETAEHFHLVVEVETINERTSEGNKEDCAQFARPGTGESSKVVASGGNDSAFEKASNGGSVFQKAVESYLSRDNSPLAQRRTQSDEHGGNRASSCSVFSKESSITLLASCARELRGHYGCSFRHHHLEEGNPEVLQSDSIIWFAVPFEHASISVDCS